MKKSYKIILLMIFLTVEVSLCRDLSKWSGYWERPLIVPECHISTHHYPSFYQSSALVWIRIYQKGISSQDLPSCVFHPSCSRFAFGSIEQYGVLKGILLASDRLLRCNPFAPKYYQFDGEKFSDPVYRYDIKKHK